MELKSLGSFRVVLLRFDIRKYTTKALRSGRYKAVRI